MEKKKMSEQDIMQLVRLKASELGAVLWRNNVGVLRDETGRPVKYGLCNGSADLIGLLKGRFIALEIKQPGKKPTQEQIDFLSIVNKNGGIGAVVTDPEQLTELLK